MCDRVVEHSCSMRMVLLSSPALKRAAGMRERREEKKERRRKGREREGKGGRGSVQFLEWSGGLVLWLSSPTLTQKFLHFPNVFCR